MNEDEHRGLGDCQPDELETREFPDLSFELASGHEVRIQVRHFLEYYCGAPKSAVGAPAE